MKKNSTADYCAFILLKTFGPLFRALPVSLCYFCGKALGFLLYHLDKKHAALAYANIKESVGRKLSPQEISRITRDFYQSLGQSIIELFLIPRIGKKYLKKYVDLSGEEHIHQALRKGKGVILLVVHECGWELSNVVAASLGVPFNVIVRDQKFPRLNNLLNDFRRQKNAKIITKSTGQLRQLVEVLKNNEAVAMTLDQGGSTGELVEFFGRNASMSTGAIKLALKYGAEVLPVFFERKSGPFARIIIEKPLDILKSGSAQNDLHDNLQKAIFIFEKHIAVHPKEYLWTYRIWKYSDLKKILLLSDSAAGHLRQVEAAGKIAQELLKEKGFKTQVLFEKIDFPSKAVKAASLLSCCLASKFSCQGCSICLKKFLAKEAYENIAAYRPDIVISCSSSAAAVNYIVSKVNLARSVVIMKPSLLSLKKFDLVIAPRHDRISGKKNVLEVNGALNLIDKDYLESRAKLLKSRIRGFDPASRYIGVLLGGDSKRFKLTKGVVAGLIQELKKTAEELDAGILLTTSRRTPEEIEKLVESELKDYPRVKLLVVANKDNPPETVGGILALSNAVVLSPESISMISEAASSGKPVLVLKMDGLSNKHQAFLENLSQGGFIAVSRLDGLSAELKQLIEGKKQNKLDDRARVKEALRKII